MSLTRPLGLIRHLRRPDMRLEVVPWLNVLLVGCALFLLGSQFIYSPGLTVALTSEAGSAGPATVKLPGQLNLPKISGGTMPGQPTQEVLTLVLRAKNDQTFLFEGGIFYRLEDLKRRLSRHTAPPAGQHEVLLLKLEADVTIQTFLEISDMARQAGYTDVQLAAKAEAPVASPIPGAPAPAGAKSP